MDKQLPPQIEKFPTAKQRRLDKLLDKISEGTITTKEKVQLERLVAEAERLMMANTKRLAAFAQRQKPRQSARGMPVTVWVQSAPTGS